MDLDLMDFTALLHLDMGRSTSGSFGKMAEPVSRRMPRVDRWWCSLACADTGQGTRVQGGLDCRVGDGQWWAQWWTVADSGGPKRERNRLPAAPL